jgi:flagellar biosynthesis GTPase FlhF
MMAKRKKTKELTKKQLDILYECWKDADNYKDRLALIEERLSKIPSLAALSIMRKMAKTDTKWLKWATRKKNQKEQEKLAKKKERERKEKEKEKKKIEREKKKKEKSKVKKEKNKMNKIRKSLKKQHIGVVQKQIKPDFFFCGTFQHFVNNISCIYRVFSRDDGFPLGSQCDKCSKMNKYTSIIEEIIKNAGKEVGKHKTSKGGRKIKKSAKNPSRKKST